MALAGIILRMTVNKRRYRPFSAIGLLETSVYLLSLKVDL